MILFIDATDLKTVRFALIAEGFFADTRITIPYEENHTLLKHMVGFLKKHRATHGVTKIICSSGPGSFTGIRVSIAMAQGYAQSIHVPCYAVPATELPTELYKLLSFKPHKKFHIDYGRAAV